MILNGITFSFPKVNAYLKLGESYIFSANEYERSRYYLEKTLEVIGDSKTIGIEKKEKWYNIHYHF